MSSHLQRQLQALSDPRNRAVLAGINRGIEKESLRIDQEGKLAQTSHPVGLGSALTHSSITTDYSEALLEFITPVSTSIEDSLETLENIHSFVYRQLDEELLWAASMPCIVTGDEGIPVARYGNSNVARMKTVYRYGLGHRYGRLMQAIAGIHYNFSMPQAYWQSEWAAADKPGELGDYITDRYLGLIRNFKRYSWLLIYLFGASPAVCRSFLRGRDNHGLEPFDEQGNSMYLPYGTALRMGDLGYNSAAQKSLSICYNSLDNYVETLRCAIMQSHPAYADIPCGQGGNYQQLNDSLLQIDNEFYSPIRPKRVTRSGETPLNALRRGGIEYVEVRCVDVSPFSPVGLDAGQIRFLDTFLLYCLLRESPPCDDQDQATQTSNMEAVVNRGRQPGLTLAAPGGSKPLQQWAGELLVEMQDIAQLMDAESDSDNYSQSLRDQADKVSDPELTPSARILREMREQQVPFFRLAMNYSLHWAEHFRSRQLSPELLAGFETESSRSLNDQAELERNETLDFDRYLANFYAQYDTL